MIDRNTIRRIAPSVFATQPWDGVSHNYQFVPTADVIDMMEDEGFHVTKAMQSRSRIPGKSDFTKHMVRLRHKDHVGNLNVNDEVPEIVLVNSHDRTSAYKIYTGIFRLVCSNGMVVQSVDFGGVSIRHSGRKDIRSQVIDATYRIMEDTPALMSNINEWKQIELTPEQRQVYASAALELKDNKIASPETILQPRRYQDRKNDLWTTSQIVQEHMIKGGDRGIASTGRRTTTRAVKSVSEDVRLNKALWSLTEHMAKLVN